MTLLQFALDCKWLFCKQHKNEGHASCVFVDLQCCCSFCHKFQVIGLAPPCPAGPMIFQANSVNTIPDSKVHGADMGPTWVLSAPDGPHVGAMNLAIRDAYLWPGLVCCQVIREKTIGMVWFQHILGFLMGVDSLQPSLFQCQWMVWNADTYLCSFETIQSINSGVNLLQPGAPFIPMD